MGVTFNETFKVACAWIAHISENDNVLLQAMAEKGDTVDRLQVVMSYEYGFLVSVWHWHGLDEDPVAGADMDRKLLVAGFSEAYINLCRIAGRQRFKYLNLDRDAESVDDVPEFQW